MAHEIRRVEYFYTTVEDRPGAGYRILTLLAGAGVDLLALTAIPVGPNRTQLTLFPERPAELQRLAGSGLNLDGPHPALLIRGADVLGALSDIHEHLAEAGVNVYAASGVTGGGGTFGYIVYVRPGDVDAALNALGAAQRQPHTMGT
jgi:predicted amino acid-binding ACT domain protein